MLIASVSLVLCGLYVGVGLVYGAVFILTLVDRLDPSARGAPWTFRCVILPGCVALWPLLAVMLTRRGGRP